jgi:hypothetical protein
MKTFIDSVKLQRELRAKADEEYRGMTFEEQKKLIHERLRSKGLWPALADRPGESDCEAEREDRGRDESR